jgi:putative acetyltransferase
MKVGDSMLRVTGLDGEAGLDHARGLFRSYIAEFAASFAEAFYLHDLEAEIAGLPGRYAPPLGDLLLALEGSRPAGCVAMRDLDGGTCEMKRLYVDPAFRGRGVGRLLVEGIIHKAEHAGYRRMVLDTLPEMVGAIALYRSFGFVKTSPYWDCPVERAIFLERWLTG